MSNPIAQKLRQTADELNQIADAFDALADERDYYKGMARRWAEVVERENLTYAERTQYDVFMEIPAG